MAKRRPTYYELKFGRRAPHSPAKFARDRFYRTSAWRRVRAAHLARAPLCVDPFGTHGERPIPATVVDHVVPRSERPELELDTRNLQSLCARCHNRKTRGEQG